jgi:chaperonin GroEL (HSP60 family)
LARQAAPNPEVQALSVKHASGPSEVDERLAALVTNVNAVRAIASAVEGTIGPKGLNTMLVDRFGDVTITNDGITILEKMEAGHPAARLVINTARSQEDEVGDGTTTATIMAGTLVAEGFNQVVKGVPVTRVIEGIRFGIERAVADLRARAAPVTGLDDERLYRVALVAGREHSDIARLVVAAARLVGMDKLLDSGFRLADTVVSREGARNEAFSGTIVDKEPLNDQMPKDLSDVLLLVLDDALEPDEVEDEALATESGFRKLMEYQEQFRTDLAKVVELGVRCVIVDRGVDDAAEDYLTDAGIMLLHRVSSREWRKVAEHCGARPIKRTALHKPAAELRRYLGWAEHVYVDEKLEHVRVLGGRAKPMATILVGAATREVMDERERIAKDAAAAAQSAVRAGLVAGGGAAELSAVQALRRARSELRGMAVYGVDCVIEALRRPLGQIVHNAGFNALEKVGEAEARHEQEGNLNLGVDCDSGAVVDMTALGIFDPAAVKVHALQAAGEMAEAILRIDTIIKKRDEGNSTNATTSTGLL